MGDREAGGVGAEDGVRLHDLVQGGKGLELEVHALRDGLHHEVAAGQGREGEGAVEPAGEGGALVLGDLSLGHGAAPGALDAGQALGQQGLVHLLHPDLAACLSRALGDARSHEPAADDADALNVHVALPMES